MCNYKIRLFDHSPIPHHRTSAVLTLYLGLEVTRHHGEARTSWKTRHPPMGSTRPSGSQHSDLTSAEASPSLSLLRDEAGSELGSGPS